MLGGEMSDEFICEAARMAVAAEYAGFDLKDIHSPH
jgi:hypothetical protein